MRCSPLNWALGLRREKHNFWEKELGISLAIRLRMSANQLCFSKSPRIFNSFPCQCSWVASLENGVGWLNVPLAQRRFGFINQISRILVLSYSHLAAKLSKRFRFRLS